MKNSRGLEFNSSDFYFRDFLKLIFLKFKFTSFILSSHLKDEKFTTAPTEGFTL